MRKRGVVMSWARSSRRRRPVDFSPPDAAGCRGVPAVSGGSAVLAGKVVAPAGVSVAAASPQVLQSAGVPAGVLKGDCGAGAALQGGPRLPLNALNNGAAGVKPVYGVGPTPMTGGAQGTQVVVNGGVSGGAHAGSPQASLQAQPALKGLTKVVTTAGAAGQPAVIMSKPGTVTAVPSTGTPGTVPIPQGMQILNMRPSQAIKTTQGTTTLAPRMILSPAQVLPGMRPGQPGQITLGTLQGLPPGAQGHLLVKTENGQLQLLRVNAAAAPPGQLPTSVTTTTTLQQAPTTAYRFQQPQAGTVAVRSVMVTSAAARPNTIILQSQASVCPPCTSTLLSRTCYIQIDTFTKLPDLEAPSDCEDGFWVSFPLSGDTCAVGSTSLDRETLCIVASCTDSILSPDTSNEKIEHKFQPESPTETCIWELNTEQRKHMTLRFSQNVRPTSQFTKIRCSTLSRSVPPPTSSEKWKCKFLNVRSLAPLPYTPADKGFSLLGPSEIRCKNRSWEEPPVCISHHKFRNESVATSITLPPSLPEGHLPFPPPTDPSFTTWNLGPRHIFEESEPHGKMVSASSPARYENNGPTASEQLIPGVMFPEQDLKNDEEEKETDTKDLYEDYDTDVHHEMLTNHSLGEVDEYETEISNLLPIVNSTEAQEEENQLGIFTGLLDISLEDDLTMYIIIGAAGLLLFIIIVITSIVVYRKRYPVRLGLGRKFDTFQNPIYEKTVVRMPMQVEETEVGRKKSDAEEMSDCTVLE
ncbi:Transcription initiation factor TFIID subunit 4 [Penaeus vannamei]|uniref:Transcription initiation factor TFIID subunit 4 n=1 Tax=Penaeus vannamei TaxID=6689 RepID=A0A423TPY5_PENVA|nr:Transcription initiation factor TFIID subunit 4 [Penaeus vannamei]